MALSMTNDTAFLFGPFWQNTLFYMKESDLNIFLEFQRLPLWVSCPEGIELCGSWLGGIHLWASWLKGDTVVRQLPARGYSCEAAYCKGIQLCGSWWWEDTVVRKLSGEDTVVWQFNVRGYSCEAVVRRGYICVAVDWEGIQLWSKAIIPFMIPLNTALSYLTLNLKFFKKYKS